MDGAIRADHEVTGRRVVAALALGAGAGGAIETATYLFGLAEVNGMDHLAAYGLDKARGWLLLTSAVWLLFLTVLAGPFWLILHRLRLRGWLTAILLGTVLTVVVTFAPEIIRGLFGGGAGRFSAGIGHQMTVIDNVTTPYGWLRKIQSALTLAYEGLIVSLIIWRVAYRTGPHPDRSPGDGLAASVDVARTA